MKNKPAKAAKAVKAVKAVKIETPLLPVAKSKTRQELVEEKAKLLEQGEITLREFGEELKLTDKQISFVEIYTSPAHLGDKVEAAMQAYGIDPTEKKARTKASQLATQLTKHQGVCVLINAMLHSCGYSVENAQRQLAFLLNQHADLKMKGIAAKIVLEAEGKLNKNQQISITHTHDYSALSFEELFNIKKALDKASGRQLPPITDIEEIK